MFYCENCRIKRTWPKSLFKSWGPCECCGTASDCYERKSSELPPVKPAHPLVDLIETDRDFSTAEVLALFGKYYQDLFLWTGQDDTQWLKDNVINHKKE